MIDFKAFEGISIIVVGDIMLDSYWHGLTERMSPEAPIPVFDFLSEENRLGGAANVALNLKALGICPLLIGVIGDDEYGRELLRLMEKERLLTEGILIEKGRKTTVKRRLLVDNKQILRVDREDKAHLEKQTNECLIEKVESLIKNHQPKCLIFQDYDKGVLSEGNIGQLIELAHYNDMIVTVDPKKDNFLKFKGVDLFKPNLKELQAIEEINDPNQFGDIAEAGRNVLQKLQARSLLITLGERGMLWLEEAFWWHLPATQRKVVDVCGAGDTVISSVSAALAIGMPKEEAMLLANIAAGIVIEMTFVSIPDKQRLLNEFIDNQQNISMRNLYMPK